MRLLEVIACCVEDAVAAASGGADRLEIVRDLDVGGLTPPVSLVPRPNSKSLPAADWTGE